MPPLDDSSASVLEDGRDKTPDCMAFVSDAATELAVREGMAAVMPGLVECRGGGVRAAIVAMGEMPTPRLLIVDLSGEENPLSTLEQLSDVVEPHVSVLVIGEVSSLEFYREVTRGFGATEYLAKPVTRDSVARHFGPAAQGRGRPGDAGLGGRMVTVTGVRGGVGASTIAVNLSHHFGVAGRRHTVLLDADLHFGVASFLLNVPPGRGLSLALQTPERIDTLLAERAAYPVTERLHVLSTQEGLGDWFDHAPSAAGALVDALRRRYNFIVADVPFRPVPLNRELLRLSHRRVLVLDPTLASVRDALRLIAMGGPTTPELRPILVLNRQNTPGGLNRRQLESALKRKVDVSIPDLPKQVGQAATLGRPEAALRGPFQAAIKELSALLAESRASEETGRGKRADRARTGRPVAQKGAGSQGVRRLFGTS